MVDEQFRYRFCVRAKVSPNNPEASRPAFITKYHMTEDEVSTRFEVIERLEHTAKPPSAIPFEFD